MSGIPGEHKVENCVASEANSGFEGKAIGTARCVSGKADVRRGPICGWFKHSRSRQSAVAPFEADGAGEIPSIHRLGVCDDDQTDEVADAGA